MMIAHNGKIVDLHTHTNRSDGSLTPDELLRLASERNLSAISITDHDTVAAYDASLAETAKALGIEIIPGIEFSTVDEKGRRYHILGLLIDVSNQELLETSKMLLQQRRIQATQSAELLRQAGWLVDQNIIDDADSITKSILAAAVLKKCANFERLAKEFGNQIETGAFVEKYLIPGKPCYAAPEKPFLPQFAIEVIHKAGGLAILAHPSFYALKGEDLEELCERFVKLDIDGFEALNIQIPADSDTVVEHKDFLIGLAEKNGLVISGGSDFHNPISREVKLGSDLGLMGGPFNVGYNVLVKLRERQKARSSSPEHVLLAG